MKTRAERRKNDYNKAIRKKNIAEHNYGFASMTIYISILKIRFIALALYVLLKQVSMATHQTINIQMN